MKKWMLLARRDPVRIMSWTVKDEVCLSFVLIWRKSAGIRTVSTENPGDFPTAVGVPKEIFEVGIDHPDGHPEHVRLLFERYDLYQPETQAFNRNIGTIEAVEKLRSVGISFIFMSEHSCESIIPEEFQGLILILSAGGGGLKSIPQGA